MEKEIRNDVRKFAKVGKGVLFQEASFENVKQFNWTDLTKDVEKNVPLLYSAMKSAITTKENSESLIG